MHPGSNPPPLKDMLHVAVCTHSQTRAIIFLQPYRYFVSIAVAHETQTSSFPPDEADSSVICTDTAHPLTSFAPTKTPQTCQNTTTPCDVNANKQRANDRRDNQPLILDLKRTTGYCVLRQYRSNLHACKRLCGVTPTPLLPKAGEGATDVIH